MSVDDLRLGSHLKSERRFVWPVFVLLGCAIRCSKPSQVLVDCSHMPLTFLSGSMAGQPGNTPSASATATLVGNAFVSQYYNVLHVSPHNVHRFYTDQSKLSRAEVGINADIVETQDKIQEKIMSMNLDGVQAQIKTVDSLASLNGSVLVMVTGALSNRIGLHRNFVQTFFLAPQEKGYFVLSDICRFLDGEGDHMPEVITVSAAVEQEIEFSPASQREEYPTSQELERDSTDVGSEGVKEQTDFTTSQEMPVKEEIESVVNAPLPQESVLEEAEEQIPAVKVESTEGATKMSYASIVQASGASFAASRPAGPRKMPTQQATSAPSTTASQGPSQETVSSGSAGLSSVVQDGVSDGGDGLSVYVKNLPLSILQDDLEKEFQKFGSVKPGGVNLRNQKQGVCFAFIQFEDASSVRSAIEASPISIGGRQVYIEEKKPTSMGPTGGRGRAGQGRVYQVDGMNGRGNFGEGQTIRLEWDRAQQGEVQQINEHPPHEVRLVD
ncbi:hypothetical protein GOP47_0021067 [Adiantum capillus-veneris]|uniref:G3BP-like protein n=1 Tax=Adiantum capillus-veneris TaxID=13818 RepID=A0A9D4UAS5_ADICA|nr:hypothetical protein GOP47_0021067 [Adiantum capillus-veneris]